MDPMSWADGPAGGTPVTATRLNLMVQGILDNQTAIGQRIPAAEKGAANGVATLGSNGKIPAAQVPVQSISGVSLSGTYAARPVASALQEGTQYTATDVQETYRATPSGWQVIGCGGNELGYAEISTDFPTTAPSSSKADITGLSITFMAGERPVEIKFGGLLITSGGSTNGYAGLVLDGATKAEAGGIISGGFQSYERSRRISGLTPGTMHTFKATLGTTAGTITASGASINPAWVSVVNR